MKWLFLSFIFNILSVPVMADHAWVDTDGRLYVTEFEPSNSVPVALEDHIGMSFTNSGGAFVYDADRGIYYYRIHSLPSQLQWFQLSSEDTFQSNTTYVVHFRALRSQDEDPDQNQISVYIGDTYHEDYLVPTNSYTTYRTFLVNADDAGLVGQSISMKFIAQDNTEGGCINQFRIYDCYLAAITPLAVYGNCHMERSYHDNNLRIKGGVPDDIYRRYTNTTDLASWTNSLLAMHVYSVSSTQYDWHLDNIAEEMRDVMYQYGVRVNFNDAILNRAVQTTNDLSGVDFQYSVDLISDQLSNGWDVSSVALQSVLSKGLSYDVCSLEERIDATVRYVAAIRTNFPNMTVGIIDALASQHRDFSSAYIQLKDALSAEGLSMDFVYMDYPVNYAIPPALMGTYDDMIYVEQLIRHMGWQSGLYLTGSEPESNLDYQIKVMTGFEGLLDAGGRPESVVLSSWFAYPTSTIPDNIEGDTQLATFRQVDELMYDYDCYPAVPIFYDGFESSMNTNWTVCTGTVTNESYGGFSNLMFTATQHAALALDMSGESDYDRIRLTCATRVQSTYSASQFLKVQWYDYGVWQDIDTFVNTDTNYLRYEYVLPGEVAERSTLRIRFVNIGDDDPLKYSQVDEVLIEGLHR